MEKWIKCSDRMPDKYVAVLGLIEQEDNEMVVVYRERDDSFTVSYTAEKCEIPPTYWTPLPMKPQKPREPMNWLDALL